MNKNLNEQGQERHKNTANDRNIRYRRRKNFIKKGFELSQICGFDVIIMTYDKKMNKLVEIYTTPDFTLTQANKMISEQATQAISKKRR